MTRSKYLFLIVISLSILISSCDPSDSGPPETVMGYMPVYLQKTGNDTIKFLSPQPTIKGGKIYVKDNFLYQVELYAGIHIIDISDPEHAEKVGFYEIFGCTQLTMQDNYMYVNSSEDFLVVDISNFQQPKVVSYDEGYFEAAAFPPPPEFGYFECIDPSKGIVTEWKEVTLKFPKCRY
jgi:hypothetical protein